MIYPGTNGFFLSDCDPESNPSQLYRVVDLKSWQAKFGLAPRLVKGFLAWSTGSELMFMEVPVDGHPWIYLPGPLVNRDSWWCHDATQMKGVGFSAQTQRVPDTLTQCLMQKLKL